MATSTFQTATSINQNLADYHLPDGEGAATLGSDAKVAGKLATEVDSGPTR